ncbi:hypothetical protein U1Q18_032071 [Sarracenia purpurea var. burkii]
MNGAWFRQQQWRTGARVASSMGRVAWLGSTTQWSRQWLGDTAQERDGVAVRHALGAMLGEDNEATTRGPRFKGERVDCALLIPKPNELVAG